MKTKFDNRQCAHVWAQQTQDSGHSDSMSFSGPTLYSYATPIARIYRSDALTDGGQRVVLCTSENYSVTTSGKHMPAMHRALRSTDITFSVPHVLTDTPAGYDGTRDSAGRASIGTHELNLAYLRMVWHKEADKQLRARDYTFHQLRLDAEQTVKYARLFGLDLGLAISEDANQARVDTIVRDRAARLERDNTPAKIAARARAAAKKAEAKAIQDAKIAAAGADELERWRVGATPYPYVHGLAITALRIKGNEVQTSRGASVPVKDARRVIPLIRKIAARGKNADYDTTTEVFMGLRVGHFTVDTIYANGDIQAGCHFIKAAEINRIALELGL